MSFFSKLGQRVCVVLLVIGTIPLLFMMVLIVANSLGRALFRTPVSGTIELAGIAGAVVVAAAVGFTARERGNVSVDVLVSRLRSKTRAGLDAVTYALSLVGVGFLLWAVGRDILKALDMQEATMTMSIPIAPFKIAWAVGLFITACFLLGHTISGLKTWRQK